MDHGGCHSVVARVGWEPVQVHGINGAGLRCVYGISDRAIGLKKCIWGMWGRAVELRCVWDK